MKDAVPSVVGLRQEEAVQRLQGLQRPIRIVTTQPPKRRVGGEPVAWRVICQRETEEGLELVVTPEWIDWLPLSASETMEELSQSDDSR